MFGVLVVVLCPDCIADLGFCPGERHVSFIVSSCILRAVRLRTGGIRFPSVRARGKRSCRSGLSRNHDCLSAILQLRPRSLWVIASCDARRTKTQDGGVHFRKSEPTLPLKLVACGVRKPQPKRSPCRRSTSTTNSRIAVTIRSRSKRS
jgi:hypothetical protein